MVQFCGGHALVVLCVLQIKCARDDAFYSCIEICCGGGKHWFSFQCLL